METLEIDLNKAFDKLWLMANNLCKKTNPCQIGKCGKHTCIARKVGWETDKQICCDGCQYWTNKGCSTIQPLSCRVWFCDVIQDKHTDLYDKSVEIAKLIYKFGFYSFRGGRDSHIKSAMGKFHFLNFYDNSNKFSELKKELETFVRTSQRLYENH